MKEKKHKNLLENLKRSLPLIMICIFGALLRFYKLSHIIFHLDEPPHTIQIAAKSLSFVLTHDYGSVLYQLLVHFLMPLGKLEFVSRLPAALFGIFIILGTYYVGKLFFGRREGLIASLFVCFSHYLLRYSQYARAYTAFAFFSLLSLYFFYKAIKENKTKYWILYLIFTVINIYFHLFSLVTVFVYFSFVGILLVEKFIRLNKKKSWLMDKKRLIHFMIHTFLILIFTYCLRYPVQITSGRISQQKWIADILERITGPPTIGFFPLINDILTHQIYSFPSLFYFLALFFIIFGIIGCLIRLRKEDILLLLYIMLPILSFFLIKPSAGWFLSSARYFIFILPLIFILSAKGISFLCSFFTSLAPHFGFIRKREYFYRNLALTILVLSFFLLECSTLKEHSDYVWKLRSLNLSKPVQSLLKDNVNRGEMIFFDSFPNKARVLLVAPVYLKSGEKKLMIHSPGRMILETLSQRRCGLWLVLNNSWLRVGKTNNLNYDFSGAEIRNIDGNTIIHWKADEEPLIKNLIEMVKFLIPIHSDKEEEYRLLLAKFHLLDMNIKKSLKELEILEKTKFSHLGERKDTERAHPFLQFIGKLNVYNKDYKQIVQDTLYSDIGRQLWILGNKFLSEERFDEAISALDKCTQLSDKHHTLVEKKFGSLGNRLFRLGRIDEAIYTLNKATKLNPHNYMYHLSLAEAYRKKGMMNKSIDEYRKGFNKPFLSNKFLHQIISKPRLFAIWKENITWHFMWRSDNKCTFSGKIYFNRKIENPRKYRFGKQDILNHFKDHAAEFVIRSDKRAIKSLDIDVGKKSQLTCYVKINDRIMTNEIVYINSGKNPEKVPFSLSSVEMKHTDKKDSSLVN